MLLSKRKKKTHGAKKLLKIVQLLNIIFFEIKSNKISKMSRSRKQFNLKFSGKICTIMSNTYFSICFTGLSVIYIHVMNLYTGR